jgi:hypothetical protein
LFGYSFTIKSTSRLSSREIWLILRAQYCSWLEVFQNKGIAATVATRQLQSSSSVGTTTLSWVSACSTIVEHSQQEGFTECRCQRHVEPPTWRRTRYLERSNFRHKRPPVSGDASEPSSGRWNYEREMAEKFCRKWRLPRHFWVLLHALKHDMGQTAVLPLRRKAC